MKRFQHYLLGACAVMALSTAHAQKYPDKPITIVVPFSPGGVSDVMARHIAVKLQEDLATPVIVTNKPGAGTLIATNFVAKSAPDGYTILRAASSFGIGPSLYKEKAGYDPEKHFKPLSLLADVPHIIVVHPKSKLPDVASLVRELKSSDGKHANYASSGSGTSNHLEGELFASIANMRATHIPFKGSVPALTAVASGEISFMFVDIAAAKPFLEGGRVQPLAVTTQARSPAMPDLPTVAESGVKNFSATPWLGFVVPAQTPDSVVDTLSTSLRKLSRDPQTRERFAAMGLDPKFTSPRDFQQFMQADRKKWEEVIVRANIVPE